MTGTVSTDTQTVFSQQYRFDSIVLTLRATPSVPSYLPAEAIRAVRLVGPEAAEVERVMIDWFGSPFWLSDTSVASWFDRGRDMMSAVPQVMGRVAESELAAHIRDVSGPSCSPVGPVALVDRFMGSSDSRTVTSDLLAVTSACAPHSITEALIWCEGGYIVSSSVPTLLAIVMVDSIQSSVRFPVDHGIRRLLGTTRHKGLLRLARRPPILPSGTTVVGVGSLLPTTAGMTLRAHLVASSRGGVPIALYPLVAGLVPEVSGDLVPLIQPKGLLQSPKTSSPIRAVSPIGTVAWGLGLMVSSPLGRLRRSGYRLSATVLRRLHPLTRTTLAARVLAWFGIDSTASRGLVTRLRSNHGTNPWLSARERRSARFQVVLGTGNSVDVNRRSCGDASDHGVEVASC